jgi:DNA-binding IclR family transcriptional regulator
MVTIAGTGERVDTGAAPRKTDGDVAALRRGLTILDVFVGNEREQGVNEIARITGMHKSTVSRLAATLENAGYLERVPSTGQFRLGPRIFHLSGAAPSTGSLRVIAHAVMTDLVAASRETVTLGVRDHLDVVTVEVVEGLNFVRMASRVGMRTQVHASAVAKAILAWTPEAEVDEMLATAVLSPLTVNTLTDPARYKESLADVRTRGYSVDMEEMEIGLRCVGAPIRGSGDRVDAAISISAPRHRMSDGAIAHFGRLVVVAADRISHRLGASRGPAFALAPTASASDT